MQNFLWPGNYIQLERILSQLVSTAKEHLIRLNDVLSLLQYEETFSDNGTTGHDMLNLKQPLYLIEREIVNKVLKECDNNQTAAAKRLGISRTTLWRILKETE